VEVIQLLMWIIWLWLVVVEVEGAIMAVAVALVGS
jgi:hypothetical protein